MKGLVILMPKRIDEIGNIYNNLKVIGRDTNKTNRAYWICECIQCGEQYVISGTDLRLRNKSCNRCELIGKTFGNFKVIGFDHISNDRHKYWKCQCKCGNIETIRGTQLTSLERTQCLECNKQNRKKQYIDEVNNRYGRLTVLEYDEELSGKNAYWKCRCECGNTVSVLGISLRNKTTLSCGCLKSKGEYKINQLLNEASINYKTQISFNNCVYKQPLKFDFGIYDDNDNLLYLIEYDGEQHFLPIWGQKLFEENKIRDSIKNEYCKKNHIPLIRIPYTKYQTLSLNDLKL